MNNRGIVVEELAVAEIELMGLEEADPRLEPLSLETRALIARRFANDVDLAIQHAEKVRETFRFPPPWVTELVGPRKGWHNGFLSRQPKL